MRECPPAFHLRTKIYLVLGLPPMWYKSAVHGGHVLPDSNAECRGESPEWLYTVKFDPVDLWGKEMTASWIYVDCWESYLEDVA